MSVAHPTEQQSDQFDEMVDRIGDDVAKHALGLYRDQDYEALVVHFDGLAPAAADRALGALRAAERRMRGRS